MLVYDPVATTTSSLSAARPGRAMRESAHCVAGSSCAPLRVIDRTESPTKSTNVPAPVVVAEKRIRLVVANVFAPVVRSSSTS